MGWGLRLFAALLVLIFFFLGAWPISLLVLLYLVLSSRKRRPQTIYAQREGALAKPKRPWGRYVVGAFLFLVSVVALESGGTSSPVVFFVGGVVAFAWPSISKAGFSARVDPVKDSVLLRSRLFPLLWHALAEVKLESQDQTRGLASMSGRLLLFAGKSPTVYQDVSACALGYRQAENDIMKKLRQETRLLSQRGAHLLPVDSAEAAKRLSVKLEKLKIGTDDFEAISSLPFDSAVFKVKDGRLVSHRAFNILESGTVSILPAPDLKPGREPLFAEVVQEIGEKHGWPQPDAFSPFLASLDASRTEPLADRFQMKGEADGKVTVETPGGAQVRLTRAQARALARIYG
ncbi:MAG: hypothetical protein JRN06_11435 [Nitrososphaerota archaeon]|nr:hypothetical protein [Nitrososphaerota archaeon]MDG7024704.1 hypothetical protein [Nitrososphaerota archaeon]